MRIAVVGGGITGLVSSALLARRGHRVTLLEAQPQLGGVARWVQFGGHQFCPGPQYFWGMEPDGEAARIQRAAGVNVGFRTLPRDFDWLAVGDAPFTGVENGLPRTTSLSPRGRSFVESLDRLGRAGEVISQSATFRRRGHQMLAAVATARMLSWRDKAELFRFRNSSISEAARAYSVPLSELRAITYPQGIFAERLGTLSVVLFAAALHHLKRTMFVPEGGVVTFMRALTEAPHRAGVDVRLRTSVRSVGAGKPFTLDTTSGSFEADHVLWCCSPGVVRQLAPGVAPKFEKGNSIGAVCFDVELDDAAQKSLRDRNYIWFADDADVEFRSGVESGGLRTLNFTSPTLNADAPGRRQVICAFFPITTELSPALTRDVSSRLEQCMRGLGEMKVHDLSAVSTQWNEAYGAFEGAVYGRRMSPSSLQTATILPQSMSVAHSAAGIPGVLGCLQMAQAVVHEIDR